MVLQTGDFSEVKHCSAQTELHDGGTCRRVELTFPLNGFQEFGQHGRRSLGKGKLLRQVRETEAWRKKEQNLS